MKTRINIFDHADGRQEIIEVALSRKVIIERLRALIGNPQFELWENLWESEIFAYCRFDADNIVLHIFGTYTDSTTIAFKNQIFGALERKVIA